MTLLLIIYIITTIVLFLYSIVMVRYTIFWKNLAIYKTNSAIQPSTQISIIVAVRNEEKHLNDCLNSLNVQDYPSNLFEILIINDNSTDLSAKIANDFFMNHPTISGTLIILTLQNLPLIHFHLCALFNGITKFRTILLLVHIMAQLVCST